MFTIKDEVQNPEGISATDISYGDSSVAEAIAKKQDADKAVTIFQRGNGKYTAPSAQLQLQNENDYMDVCFRNLDEETAGMSLFGFSMNKDKITLLKMVSGTVQNIATFTADEDTGWQTLASGVYYRKKNGMVTISMSNNSQAQTATETAVATLPEGCRPSRQIIAVGVTNQFAQYLGISVNTNGEIRTRTATGTGTGFYGSVSFPV